MPFALLLTNSNVPSKGFVINPIYSLPHHYISYVFLRLESGSCRSILAEPKETVNGLGEDKTVMINLRQE